MHGLLVNNGEIRLRNLLRRYGQFDICPKVRVIDCFGEPHASWTKDETWFSFRSHFDFVLVDRDDPMSIQAAIELDGRTHQSEEQIRRDLSKTRLCRKAAFPLFRFGYHHLQEALGESGVEYVLYVWACDRYNAGLEWSDEEAYPLPPKFLTAPPLKAQQSGDPCVYGGVTIYEHGEDDYRGRWVRESAELRLASGRSATATCMLSESTVPIRGFLLDFLAGDFAEYECWRKLGLTIDAN